MIIIITEISSVIFSVVWCIHLVIAWKLTVLQGGKKARYLKKEEMCYKQYSQNICNLRSRQLYFLTSQFNENDDNLQKHFSLSYNTTKHAVIHVTFTKMVNVSLSIQDKNFSDHQDSQY